MFMVVAAFINIQIYNPEKAPITTSAKKEANIGNESKQGETSQSNLELWTEFETAFPDPADSKC